MPPRTQQTTTRKRQVSNVDEMVNKRPKINDSEDASDQKKGMKKQPKGRTQK